MLLYQGVFTHCIQGVFACAGEYFACFFRAYNARYSLLNSVTRLSDKGLAGFEECRDRE
jgi:hypothetical protein